MALEYRENYPAFLEKALAFTREHASVPMSVWKTRLQEEPECSEAEMHSDPYYAGDGEADEVAAADSGSALLASVQEAYVGMGSEPNDSAVQQRWLAELAELAGDSAAAQTIILRTGGLPRVLKCMRVHLGSENVQLLGCYLIQVLLQEKDNAVAVVAGGCVNSLLTAMEQFQDDPTSAAVLYACGAMVVISYHSLPLYSKRCLDAIRGVLEQDGLSSGVASSCISVILNICDNENVCNAVDAAGLIEEVLGAMEEFADDADIAASACGALSRLCCYPGPRTKVIAAGGFDKAIKAIEKWTDEEDACYRAAIMLDKLVEASTCKAQLLLPANAAIIVSALNASFKFTSSRPCSSLVSVLYELAGTSDGNALLLSSGGLTAFVAAMTTFPEASAVQQMCTFALYNLAVSADNLQPIVDAGAVPPLLAAVSYHVESSKIMSNGLFVLARLCRLLPGVKTQLKARGVALVNSVNAAKARMPSLTSECNALLAALA